MVSANRQKIIVRQAPAIATGVFLIVVLLVGDVDSSRTIVLPARSSTVFLRRISAVLQGNDGSGQRGRKLAINATANARFVLRLHADAGSNQFPGGQAKRLRFVNDQPENRSMSRRGRTRTSRACAGMSIASLKTDARGARKTGPRRTRHTSGCDARRSGWLDICSLLALRPHLHIEAHFLVFLQRLDAFSLDFGKVGEQVFAAVIRGDEAKALRIVEPFHSASCHFLNPVDVET